MDKKKINKIVVYAMSALIGCLVGVIVGAYVIISVKSKPHRKPVLTEWEMDIPRWIHAAYVDPVYMKDFQFTDETCVMTRCNIYAGMDTVYQFGIYGIDYQYVAGMLFDDSIAADTIIFYHMQGDSIVMRTSNSTTKGKYIQTRMQMNASGMERILSDTISAIGFYSLHHGLVKTPVRPEATEDMQRRYELLKEHINAD